MLKKVTGFLFLIAALFLIFAPAVSAHTLRTDGTIGAVLHIDPDDSPIASQPTNFYLDFRDTTSRFNLSLCDCNITLSESGNQIFTTRLIGGSDTNTNLAIFTFTFLKKDIYSLVVTGSPQTSGAFQSFKLTYDIRVDRDAQASQSNSFFTNNIILIVFFAILLVVVVVYLFRPKTKKLPASKKEKPNVS